MGYSVKIPAKVIFAIMLLLDSVNQRLPSGPDVIPMGLLPAVGTEYSVNITAKAGCAIRTSSIAMLSTVEKIVFRLPPIADNFRQTLPKISLNYARPQMNTSAHIHYGQRNNLIMLAVLDVSSVPSRLFAVRDSRSCNVLYCITMWE